ncbi:MAG TPA: haloacid dehalogenase-like hydrolase [Anaeromyxobacteraceae bacterium]|nr:haloacid dehalogenase-like hydrolase [Anaeromyxobacteraceae bacterium]
MRVADRLVIHGEPIDFRTLCLRTVPTNAKYLVLDLDRTVHLARNMGELLGWEVGAWHSYGPEHLAAAEPRRPQGRFFIDWRHPLAALRYLFVGARLWAYPGLFYLLFGKLPGRFAAGRRWTFRRFGSDPVSAVQLVPQTALLHQLAAIPAAELRQLAQRVWDRHAGDQVIERSDLEWLRARCPGIRIVIATASPQPIVEAAAEALGADDVIFSTVEQHEGWFSSPFLLHPALSRRPPRRLSGPRDTHINSSRAKVDALLARYPDLADPATVSVGMTDTGYGEDHCWLGHFTRVVDVNSSSPFPPFVSASSPLQEIHSAAVLTRTERARRAEGEPTWTDPRRPARDPRDRVFTAIELSERLAEVAERVEQLARRREERAAKLAEARERLAQGFEPLMSRIDAVVRAFNEAAAEQRPALLAELRRELRANHTLRRELARLERPVAEITCAMTTLFAAARAALGAKPRHDAGSKLA